MPREDDNGWNAAIEAVHKLVDEAAGGRGPLWEEAREYFTERGRFGVDPTGGTILDLLPNAIWALRRSKP